MSEPHLSDFDLNPDELRSEGQIILENLRALRNQIVAAWRERGVLLTREEQEELHAEIKQTCKFLSDLTATR